jgi:hypothetical protein
MPHLFSLVPSGPAFEGRGADGHLSRNASKAAQAIRVGHFRAPGAHLGDHSSIRVCSAGCVSDSAHLPAQMSAMAKSAKYTPIWRF